MFCYAEFEFKCKNVAYAVFIVNTKANIVGGRHVGHIARYQFRDGIHQRRGNIIHIAVAIARSKQ